MRTSAENVISRALRLSRSMNQQFAIIAQRFE